MIASKKSSLQQVLFLDGSCEMLTVHLYQGACMVGDPTAFVVRGDGEFLWVKPGESVSWVEVDGSLNQVD